RHDQTPVVRIESPTTALTVTPAARIPLRANVSDDLGLAQVRLNHAVSSRAGTGTTSLLAEFPAPTTEPSTLVTLLDTTWNLAELELQPGDLVRYTVDAQDWCTPHAQVGRSAEQSLSVVSIEEK